MGCLSRRFSLFLKLFLAFVGLVVLFLLFQLLPHPTEGQQTLSQLIVDALVAPLTAVAPILPAWIPLWTIPTMDIIDDRLPDVRSLETLSQELVPQLLELRSYPFFRYLRCNLDTSCDFWDVQRKCASESQSCGVEPVPFGDLPEGLRHPDMLKEVMYSADGQRALGGLMTSQRIYRDYVDLQALDGGYTSFKGRSIWQAIYSENCFRISDTNPTTGVRSVCTEEESFYKLLSGMQSAIMTTSSDNKYSGAFVKRHSFALFRRGIAQKPEWMANLYFVLGATIKAVCAQSDLLRNVDCYAGTASGDRQCSQLLNKVIDRLAPLCQEVPLLFVERHGEALSKIDNVTRLMDCIECDKCRVQGLMKAEGLRLTLLSLGSGGQGTAMPTFEKNMIVGLVNSLLYYMEAIQIIQKFRRRVLSLRTLWVASLGIVFAAVLRWRTPKTKML